MFSLFSQLPTAARARVSFSNTLGVTSNWPRRFVDLLLLGVFFFVFYLALLLELFYLNPRLLHEAFSSDVLKPCFLEPLVPQSF